MIKSNRKNRVNSDSFGDKILTALLYPLRIFIYYFVFQFIIRFVYKFSHRLKFNNNGLKLPNGNFLVLCNHVTNWDGLYLNTFLKKFVYFLVHDEIFKYKHRKIIAYNLFGQIQRGKVKNDIGPLRKLLDIKNSGKCIGIFPEGDISFTGRSLEIDKSIAKMCKILDMPIVLARIDGGALRNPRWSREVRKTKIQLTLTDVLNLNDIKKLSNNELYARIIKGIKYDDCKYQIEHHNIIKARKQAENLENVLFLCPDCNNVHCMESKKDLFYCNKCGYTVMLDKYNRFELIKGINYIDNITKWDDYQKSKLKGIINKSKAEGKDIISIDNFSYNRVLNGNFFYRSSDKGTLSMDYESIKFKSSTSKLEEKYYIKDIKDVYIQFIGAVEFSTDKYRYRFISKDNHHYGYWYECLINNILHEKNTEDNKSEEI